MPLIRTTWLNFKDSLFVLGRDDSTNGYDTHCQNFYFKFHCEFQKMTIIVFVCLQKICNFAKLGGCGLKIEPATPISILNFNWTWQAQFLTHTHEILEKSVFFIDLQMMLLAFFEIHNVIWDKNFGHECHIHLLSHPWAAH